MSLASFSRHAALTQEVMEVGILKYMREDTASFSNLVEILERKENIKLLERMILAQAGGKSGPSIKARMECRYRFEKR